MPQFITGDIFTGILTVLFVVVLGVRAGKPRLAAWKLALIGITGAFVIPSALVLLAQAWRAAPMLPDLSAVTPDRLLIGTWVAVALLAISHRPGKPPRLPLWGGLLAGLAVAILFPSAIDLLTGSYQRASLRTDLNHCTSGMMGQAQPREIANTCDEPIVVGLCMPDETNPAPCAQTQTIAPGEAAQFDPGEARLSNPAVQSQRPHGCRMPSACPTVPHADHSGARP